MTRALPAIITIALAIFCLIDLGMTPAGQDVRTLPRWAWVLVILFFPILGPVAWMFAGRPKPPTAARPVHRNDPAPVAPDDDPSFLADLDKRQQRSERERLQKWQAELERRERELGKDKPADNGDGPAQSG